MNINIVLGYILQLFHVLLCIFAFVAPYLTNNNLYLSILIFYYAMVLTIWHVNGKCFLTDIENYLKGETNPQESYVTNLFSNILGKHTKKIFSIVPLINTTICLYKINVNKTK
jgi:hypothetical protein